MKEYIGKTCPFCKTEFSADDDIVVCSNCDMPHHKECWIENQGCTTFGCTGTIQGVDGSVNSVTSTGFNYSDNQSVASANVYCTSCGAPNARTQSFCTKCGTRLSSSTPANNTGQGYVNNGHNYQQQLQSAQYNYQQPQTPQYNPQYRAPQYNQQGYPNSGYNYQQPQNLQYNPQYRAPQYNQQGYSSGGYNYQQLQNLQYNPHYRAPQYNQQGYPSGGYNYQQPQNPQYNPQYRAPQYNQQGYTNGSYNYQQPQNSQYNPQYRATQYNQQGYPNGGYNYQQPQNLQYNPQYNYQSAGGQQNAVVNPNQTLQTPQTESLQIPAGEKTEE